MATKYELANYLSSLHSLMEGQDKNGLLKSTLLGDEYTKHWGLLKQAITEDNEHDARTSKR